MSTTARSCRECRSCIAVSDVDGYCHKGPPISLDAKTATWPVVHLDNGFCDDGRKGKHPRQDEFSQRIAASAADAAAAAQEG